MEIKEIQGTIQGISLIFKTSNAVFSKQQLDYGSQVMLESIFSLKHSFKGTLLDVGCGYGTLGLFMAKAYETLACDLVDINPRAVQLAQLSAQANGLSQRVRVWQSDQFSQVDGQYDYILTNPPIRAGKSVVHGIYHGAYRALNPGGQLYVVIQRKQGAPSSKEALEQLFGNCQIINRQSGYHILCATKEA